MSTEAISDTQVSAGTIISFLLLFLLECLSIYNFVKLKFSNFNMSADQNDSIINKTYKHLSSQQRGLLYLFILIHFIMVSIMNNILKNYMTDG